MNEPTPIPPRGRRPRFLWISWGLVLAAIVGVGLVPELERNFQAWLRALLVALGLVLTLVWFLLLGRFRPATRIAGVALLVALWFGAPRLVRVDGTVNGTGLPNVVLRGTARTGASPAPATNAPRASVPAARDPLAADSTQFLGNRRDGVIDGVAWSANWDSAPPRQRWRIPVGAGWSAFAVAGNIAVTQDQNGPSELVVARDLATARTLWIHTNAARFFEWQGGEGPRATPTLDGDRVYTLGGTGILDCLDLADGHAVWTHDLLRESKAGNLTWGISASPLVLAGAVVVPGGAGAGPTVSAFAKADGKPIWHSGTNGSSYASPILANLLGRDRILSVNAGTFTIHEPADGTELLSFPWGDGKRPVASQPVVVGTNRVFLSAGYAMGCVMLALQPGPDGRLAATELWRNKAMKTQFNSPALRDGCLYGLDDGLLACVDAATGKRLWKDGRYGSGQSLLVGQHLVVQTEQGSVVLAAAKPDGFLELGRIPAMDSKTWNYPTVAGHLLLVRNDREAVCYEVP
jgi:outer membrane protein assembly factor BamB